MSKPKKPKKGKNKFFKKYFQVLFTILGVFVIVAGIFGAGYKFIFEKNLPETEGNSQTAETNKDETDAQEKEDRINVAIFGVDKDGYRTDVIFVVSFNPNTYEINLVSVPRDTKVTMTDEMIKGIESRNGTIPYVGNERATCKINEVHAYAGKGYRNEYSVLMLEDLLGIEIDHYAKIDLEGFKDVVNAIGGVDMEIPEDMFYEDPYQDLYINLKAGYQHLDGKKAEQLVRYRSYAQGDLKRITLQQSFLRELGRKVLTTEGLLNDLPKLIKTLIKYFETDVTIIDALKYVKYIKNINIDNVTMETIPGEGGSYFTVDEEGLKELVQRVFYDDDEEEPEPDTDEPVQTVSDSKNLNIEVANGGTINGLAGQKRDMLIENGYTVKAISTYNGERKAHTRIIVSKAGEGSDLVKYFKNAQITVEPEKLDNGIDIKIILGTDEV